MLHVASEASALLGGFGDLTQGHGTGGPIEGLQQQSDGVGEVLAAEVVESDAVKAVGADIMDDLVLRRSHRGQGTRLVAPNAAQFAWLDAYFGAWLGAWLDLGRHRRGGIGDAVVLGTLATTAATTTPATGGVPLGTVSAKNGTVVVVFLLEHAFGAGGEFRTGGFFAIFWR